MILIVGASLVVVATLMALFSHAWAVLAARESERGFAESGETC